MCIFSPSLIKMAIDNCRSNYDSFIYLFRLILVIKREYIIPALQRLRNQQKSKYPIIMLYCSHASDMNKGLKECRGGSNSARNQKKGCKKPSQEGRF